MHDRSPRSVFVVGVLLGTTLLIDTASAHGVNATHVGVDFPTLVVGTVGASVLSGLFSVKFDTRYERISHLVTPILLVVLGLFTMNLAIARSLEVTAAGSALGVGALLLRSAGDSECRATANTTMWAVVVHRAIEGCALATVYAADAALAALGAAVLAVHAAVETAVVGSLYTRIASPRSTGIAIALVQAGFVAGALAGADVIGSVPRTPQTLLLGTVGTVFLGVGVSAGRIRRRCAGENSARMAVTGFVFDRKRRGRE